MQSGRFSPALQYLRPRDATSTCVLTCPASRTQDTGKKKKNSNHIRKVWKAATPQFQPACENLS